MGAGKETPSKGGGGGGGGDGAGKEAAAAAEPVVLGMVLHCNGCAKKVMKSIKHMPGVKSVAADAASNRVVVAGTADAAALKARIESKTRKPVEILSAGAGASSKPPPAEPKKNPDKGGGGGEQKKSPDMGGGADNKGDKAGSQSSQPHPKEEEKGKKQLPEEKKPIEDTREALLRIRLHCDACADRIRRRIYKIKGVKDVILEGNAKDEVKVVGTMDVAAMVVYLNDKLNRTVELAAPGKNDGDDKKKDKGGDGDGHVKKDKGAAAAGDVHKDKGKGVEVVGPSMASAAASLAPAPVQASTHHVSPYGYGHVAYPQPPQGPPPGYYSSYYGGNADGAGYSNSYYQQPRADAGTYYDQAPSADNGRYYHQTPSADTGSYYQHQPSADANGGSYYGGYGQDPNPQPYQPYPAYPFDTAPPPQMFSDENPNSCSVM